MNYRICDEISNANKEKIKEEKIEIINNILNEDLLNEDVAPYIGITNREYIISLIESL